MVEDVSEQREPSLLVAETSASLEPQPWSVFGPPSRPSGPSSSVPVGTGAGPRGPLPFAIVSLDPRRESGSSGVGRVSWARSWTVAGGAELKTRRGCGWGRKAGLCERSLGLGRGGPGRAPLEVTARATLVPMLL